MRKTLLVALALLCLGASDPLAGVGWTPNAPAAAGDYERALALCREGKDRLGEAYCLAALGRFDEALRALPEDAPIAGRVALERMLGEATGDVELLKKAAGRVGPELETARCLKALGNLAADAGNLVEARALYRKAQTLADGDEELSQRLLMNLGVLDLQESRYADALEQLDQVTFPALQGAVQVNRATALSRLGRDREAEQAYLAALKGLPERQAGVAWKNLAGLYMRQKRWREAEQAAQQAEKILGEDPALVLLRGNLLVDQGRLLEGRERLEQALKAFAGQELGIAMTLSSLGQANTYLGDFEGADRAFTASQEILTRLGRRAELGVLLAQRGEYWQQLGNDAKALEAYVAARNLFVALGMEEEDRRVLGNLARLLLLSGGPELALEFLERGRPGEAAGPARLSLYHQARATALACQGKWREARSEIATALELASEDGRLAVLQDLAAIDLATGRLEESARNFRAAIAGYRERALVTSALFAERSLTDVLARQGRIDEALEHGQRALDEMLTSRTRVFYGSGSEDAMLLAQMEEQLPRLVARLYLERDRPEEALNALETFRGFTEHAWRQTFFRSRSHPQVREMEELVAREDPASRQRLHELEVQFWRTERRLEQLARPTVTGIRERLPERATLLEYARLSDGWHVFAVNSKGMRHAALGEVPQATELRRLITRNDGSEAGASVEVRRALLGPLEDFLVGQERLLIVADSDLQDLPFEALRDAEGHYLIEQFAIAYLNGARELWEEPSERKSRGALVIGGVDYGGHSKWGPGRGQARAGAPLRRHASDRSRGHRVPAARAGTRPARAPPRHPRLRRQSAPAQALLQRGRRQPGLGGHAELLPRPDRSGPDRRPGAQPAPRAAARSARHRAGGAVGLPDGPRPQAERRGCHRAAARISLCGHPLAGGLAVEGGRQGDARPDGALLRSLPEGHHARSRPAPGSARPLAGRAVPGPLLLGGLHPGRLQRTVIRSALSPCTPCRGPRLSSSRSGSTWPAPRRYSKYSRYSVASRGCE